jgi:hypothetical protein
MATMIANGPLALNKPLLPKLWFSSMLKLASAGLLERNDAS